MTRQSTQPRPFKKPRSALCKPGRSTTRSPRSILLLKLLKQYPLVFLLGAWMVSATTAAIAVKTLLKVDSVRSSVAASAPVKSGSTASPAEGFPANKVVSAQPSQQSANQAGSVSLSTEKSPSPVELQQSPVPAQEFPEVKADSTRNKGTSPFLALVTIALTCASGCVLISRGLKPQRSINAGSKSVRIAKQPSVPQASPIHPSPFAPSSPTAVTAHFPPIFVDPTPDPPSSPASALTEPVTVVPPEQNHPLDWDEPSLADSLDLRQRRSISYWLKE
jgi:hypothetical protein